MLWKVSEVLSVYAASMYILTLLYNFRLFPISVEHFFIQVMGSSIKNSVFKCPCCDLRLASFTQLQPDNRL